MGKPDGFRWVFALLLLLIPGLFWGIPSVITPQVDSPVPLGSLQFFADRRPEVNNIYPAFHQLFLLPFYAVCLAVTWLTGGLGKLTSAYPYGFRDVTSVFSTLIVAGNLVSAVMAALLVRSTFPYLRAKRPWLWFGVLCAALNAPFLYYGRTGNLDMPYNFWLAAAMYFLWRYLRDEDGTGRSLLAAGAAAAAAIGSKDQAAGPVAGMGLALLLLSRDKFRNAVWFGVTVLAVYGLTAIAPNPARWVAHVKFVTSPHAPTPIPATLAGQWMILEHTFHRFLDVYTFPLFLVALAGAWALYRENRRLFWFLLLPALFYYAIIAKTRVAYPRFMLTFLVPVIVLATYGAAAAGEWLAARSRAGRVIWTAALGVFLAWRFVMVYVPVTYAQVFDIRRQVADELPSLVPPGSPVIIARMQGGNLPGAGLYRNYKLMLVPGDELIPPSRHALGTLHPFDPNAGYILHGTGGAGLPWHKPVAAPPVPAELVRAWKLPDWVRENLIVPCFYEFYLYKRTGAVPQPYTAPKMEDPDNPG